MTLTKFSSGVNTSFSTELNRNLSFTLSTSLGYALDGVTITNQDNIKRDLMTSDLSQSKTMRYDTTGDFFYADLGVGDPIDDSVINTSLWSNTGSTTFTEDTSNLTAGTFNSTGGSGTLNHLVNLFSNSNYIETRINLGTNISGSTGQTGTVTIIVDDGTNSANVKQITQVNTGSATDDSVWRLQLDTGNNQIRVWDDAVEQTSIDITGWTSSTIKLKITHSHSGGSTSDDSFCDVYYIFETDSSWNYQYNTSNFVTDAVTITTSETVNIIKLNYDNVEPTIEISYNGGSNYTTINQKEVSTISNVGISSQVRFSYTGSIFTYTNRSTNTLPKINSYAYYYG